MTHSDTGRSVSSLFTPRPLLPEAGRMWPVTQRTDAATAPSRLHLTTSSNWRDEQPYFLTSALSSVVQAGLTEESHGIAEREVRLCGGSLGGTSGAAEAPAIPGTNV